MNLTKLFNKDFFIQNIKRSRSSIIFASIILPIFTILIMLLFTLDEYTTIVDFTTLNITNIFFMYIIPLIISISLFSFVYKKNSVDFMGSMPLSRKSIFTTNTIGGILLIIAIQVITALIVGLMSITISNLHIFGLMILESMLYFIVAYIFVFIVCNLAMSFSGNMFSTIAVTMLILFLIPFLLFVSRSNSFLGEFYYYNNNLDNSLDRITFYNQFNFTAPSYIFDTMVNGVEYSFNAISMAKMIVLSIIYLIIGYQLFKHKKYEMAGESFENDRVHLIVKFLTLTPFFAIAVEGDVLHHPIAFMIFFAFLAVYYFLFDVITRKRIKLSVSIASFIAFSAIMYTIFALVVPHLEVFSKKVISTDDIESIRITSIYNDIGVSFLTDLNITDKEFFNSLSDGPVVIADENIYYCGAELEVKTNKGDVIPARRSIVNVINKLVEKYGDKKYELDLSKYYITLNGCKLTKEEEENLRDSIAKDLNGITYKELYNLLKNDGEVYGLQISRYKNHQVESSLLNSSLMENTRETVVKILNRSAYKYIGDASFINLIYTPDFLEYVRKANPNVEFDIMTKYIGYDDYDAEYVGDDEPFNQATFGYDTLDLIHDTIRNVDKGMFRDYLYNHKDDIFDKDEPYYGLFFGANEHGFYSNDIEGFYKLFAHTFNEKMSENYGFKLSENV